MFTHGYTLHMLFITICEVTWEAQLWWVKEWFTQSHLNRNPIQKCIHHPNIHAYMYLLYVNKLPLFNVRSNNIHFLTIQATSSIEKQQMIIGITYMKNIYTQHGFVIAYFHGDNELDMEDFIVVLLPEILHICRKV